MTQADDLSLTTEGGATVTSKVHGLQLRTTPRPGDLPLFARHGDLVFAGVLQVGQGTALGWIPVDGPRLRVAPPRDPRVRFLSDPGLEVPCADLTLERGHGEPTIPDAYVRANQSIAVAASPGGPAVVRLRLPGTVFVAQLDRDGTHAKIAWPIDDGALADATIIGWLDARLVRKLDKGGGGGVGSVIGVGLEGTSDWFGCQTEHPLLADAGRGPEPIGTILVGTRVRKGPRRGALVAVELIGPSLRQVPPPLKLRDGAQLLLAPDDATDCAR